MYTYTLRKRAVSGVEEGVGEGKKEETDVGN